MALVLSKHFLRTISQATKEGPTSLSLWSLADVEKAQQKARELAQAEAKELDREHGGARRGDEMDEDEDEDEFGGIGLSEDVLAAMDIDG
jgi:DNA excision repair protein ERCC-2